MGREHGTERTPVAYRGWVQPDRKVVVIPIYGKARSESVTLPTPSGKLEKTPGEVLLERHLITETQTEREQAARIQADPHVKSYDGLDTMYGLLNDGLTNRDMALEMARRLADTERTPDSLALFMAYSLAEHASQTGQPENMSDAERLFVTLTDRKPFRDQTIAIFRGLVSDRQLPQLKFS